MFETWQYADVIVSYLVGTGAGIWLFKRYVEEDLIRRTIDTLVENDYVRSYMNSDGDIELYKWYELEDLLEDAKVVIKVDGEEIEDDEKDDAA